MEFVSRRSKNFEHSETKLLMKLVNIHRDVLDCKQSDKVTIQVKRRVWFDIEEEFNKQSKLLHRDWRTLKGKYENIKKCSKQQLSGKPTRSIRKIDLTDVFKKRHFKPVPPVQDIGFDLQDSSDESDSFPSTNLNSPSTSDVTESLNFLQDEEPTKKLETSFCSHKSKQLGVANQELVGLVITDEGELESSESSDKLKSCCKFYVSNQTNYSPLRKETITGHKIRNDKFSQTDSVKKQLPVKKQEINPLRKAKQELLKLQYSILEQQLFEQQAEHQLRIKCAEEEHELKIKLLKLQVKNAELEYEEKYQNLKELKSVQN